MIVLTTLSKNSSRLVTVDIPNPSKSQKLLPDQRALKAPAAPWPDAGAWNLPVPKFRVEGSEENPEELMG